MTWRRGREVKPGVWETQSFGFHAASQVGGGVAVVLGLMFGSLVIVMTIYSLFSGDLDLLGIMLLVSVPLFGLPYWHYRHYKAHPEQRRRPGPWD